jgi:hypothetical protein
MTQITIDHSGQPLPQPKPHDDGYEYNLTGLTQPGDEVYSDYGGRWLTVVYGGFHMPGNLRYRRRMKADKGGCVSE